MSILIKDMEMPKTCDDCILLRHYRFLGEPILCCEANDRELVEVEEYEKDKKRLSDCPLVEVPAPHGDLIDRDALNIGEYEQEDDDSGTLEISIGGLLSLYHGVIDAPPVIEAERRTDETD